MNYKFKENNEVIKEGKITCPVIINIRAKNRGDSFERQIGSDIK